MNLTLSEVVKITGGELAGDQDFVINTLCSIENIKADGLCYVNNVEKKDLVEKAAAAGCVIFPAAAKEKIEFGGNAIYADNPEWAFNLALRYHDSLKPKFDKGIHPTAIIGKNVKLGADITIGAYSVIEDDCSVGDNTVIYPHVYVGRRTTIGANCLIYPNVTIREECVIKHFVVIEAGAVIGGDGFGFMFINGKHEKVPQIGNVIIESDAEIGANTTIDRAKIDSTIIGPNVKIDNLVQIGHNVKIGAGSIIVSQVGIAGSTELGRGVVLGGQVGVVGHIKIGDGVMAGAQSGIMGNTEPGKKIFGTPAMGYNDTLRMYATLPKIAEMYKDVKKLKKKEEN